MSYDFAFDEAFARLSAGDSGTNGLCAAGIYPKRGLRSSPEYSRDGVTIRGPFGGNSPEFSEFEKNVLNPSHRATLGWLCSDRKLVGYVHNEWGVLDKIKAKRSEFGLYRATISAKHEDGNACDQVLAFILYRETEKENTRFVHVDLICRGPRTGDEKTGHAFVPGKKLHEYMENNVLKTTNRGIDRVQFSLDSVQNAIEVYKTWGYSTINFVNNQGPVENEVWGAWPMVKVFDKGEDGTLDLVKTQGFTLTKPRKCINFFDSDYGRVAIVKPK